MPRLICCVCLVMALWASALSADERAEQIRKFVWDFEQTLPLEGSNFKRSLAAADRERVIRFFRNLPGSETKIEAVGMLDSRYVYRIPADLTAQIVAELLKDSDEKVQIRALRAASYHQLGNRLRPDILRILMSEQVETQLAAVQAMARTTEQAFLKELLEAVARPDFRFQAEAAWGLRKYPAADTSVALRALMASDKPEVRAIGLASLAQYPGPDFPLPTAELFDALDDLAVPLRLTGLEALQYRPGAQTNRRVASLTRDLSDVVRREAVETLGVLHATDQVDAVIARLSDSELVVRRYAVINMEHVGGPEHAAHLIPLLKNDDLQTVEYACEILGRWKSKAAEPAIRELLKHSEANARRAATRAIVTIDVAGNEQALVECLDDDDVVVRKIASNYLAALPGGKHRERLEQMAKTDPDESLRDALGNQLRDLP